MIDARRSLWKNNGQRVIIIVLALMMMVPSLSVTASADTHVNIVIDGESVVFTKEMGFPFIDTNSRTQVPFRVTLETLGATVDWDAEERMAYATLNDVTVHIPIGQPYIIVNGLQVENDTESVIVNNRTYSPIRKVLEAFGCVVTWDGQTRSVLVDTSKIGQVVEEDDYTVMVFMNGTDLESQYDETYGEYAGAGTSDLLEMMAIGSTDKVNFLVETGGTLAWVNDQIDASQNQRWLVEKGTLKNVGNIGKQNMGESDTLKNYILWAVEAYPAKKYVLDLWNHGGGPIVGYGVDEHFNYDALLLEELDLALQEVKAEKGIELEIIGFDACLMASIEVANTLEPYAKYLVASEELEPGHGWDYTPIYKALQEDSTINGLALGRVIADGFYQQSVESDTSAEVTLSVTDLSKVKALTTSLDGLFTAIGSNIENQDQLNGFYKAVSDTKAFGGNTAEQGYTDLFDIGDFALKMKTSYENESNAVIEALSDSVVYKVDGQLHEGAYGLSVYLPFKDNDNISQNLLVFDTLDVSTSHKSFVKAYTSKLQNIEHVAVADAGISVDDPNDLTQGYALNLGDDLANQVESVLLNIVEVDQVNGLYRSLGYDLIVEYDEYTGQYIEFFGGAWTLFDGHKVAQQVVYIADYYIEYEIPVMLNDERVTLQAAWIFDDYLDAGGYYELYGARKAIDGETNMPDKQLLVLAEGDVIKPIFDVTSIANGEHSEEIGEAFTITSESKLTYNLLSTDNFKLRFMIQDFSGALYISEFYELIFE